MAAAAAVLGRRSGVASRGTLLVPGRCWAHFDPSRLAQGRWAQRWLLKLYQRFYDIENLFNWNLAFQNWNLRRKNVYYGYTQSMYGVYVAAAHYTLQQKGGVRFAGQEEWYRADRRGNFSWDFLKHKEVPLEAVDASGSSVTYDGLENLVCLKELKYLNLSRCPFIDDWCLSRLQVFGDSLEELRLSGCPRVTERGLASLHHLKNLKHLDLSDLPAVGNRGLVRIMLEECLPQCEIVGIEYQDGLLQQSRSPDRPPPV
ncbi:distal membrane-arm assembly complex protein 2 isoform X2 [Scyliorhinus canicula]|uniref:distal membrane-arm assembly complex protein 2 isoform X2 n=1 Tax=Scyliorhinus canicula TaxID=7830 RepID=UPI0018F6A11F|nr:distal membrane-arm assembly complex protein 2 isoform X2 [Scyliorhinus canicula]